VELVLRLGLGNAVASVGLALIAVSVGMFARGRPALRHGLWLLVLLKLVTPPLWTVPVAWVGEPAARAPETLPVAPLPVPEAVGVESEAMVEPGPWLEDGPEPSAVSSAETAPAVVPPPPATPAEWSWPWRWWVLAVWGGGSLVTFGVAAVRIARFRRILKLTEPAPAALQQQVEALAGQLGLAQVPTIGVVPGTVSPLVWALGCRPCLIVPRGLWDRLDEPQRATLLAHELAHLKRRDHWVRGLELLATGLYWWLPVVWIARQALREAEEQCCDAWVVWTFPDAARTYAEALLETLDFLAGAGPAAAVAASGLGPVHHLKRRMTMIMQGTTPRTLTWSGLLAVLGLSAMLLPLAPTWAQQKPTLEEEFWSALKEKHELNDPRFPFLIKAKAVEGHTLLDATFKHRTSEPQNPNTFDMVMQARKADVQFYPDKAVARATLDAVEITNPRDDVPLVINDRVVEIPIFPALAAGDEDELDDDEEDAASSPAAKERGRRDPGPREKGEGDRPATKRATRKEVRVYRFDREGGEQTIAALEKMLAELKAMESRKPGGLSDERAREQLKQAIERLQSLVERRRAEPGPDRGPGERARPEAERPQPRKPEAGPGPRSEGAKESAEAAEQRAEIARLKEEVAARQKALMEAQRRLAEALRRQGRPGPMPGPMARGERFEFRFGGGPGERPPFEQEKSIRIVPRPDQDKRIAELEERLEKLQDEVKSLKKDAPAAK
jgi:beta-lactamase regulating signal transducer with metallopeptidase domain